MVFFSSYFFKYFVPYCYFFRGDKYCVEKKHLKYTRMNLPALRADQYSSKSEILSEH